MKGLSSVVDEIKKEKGVEAVYLFGSQVSGKARPYSDIDLCVVTGKGAKRMRILSNSSEKIDTKLFVEFYYEWFYVFCNWMLLI